ncbi:MAG: hypothetical protein Q8R10_18505 [Pseudomonas sp.]|uniref:hypothetical protein n=1 Tax=Pseudomonas sp. TaxID=306 RepID=UPI002732A669|nr:hypothetical protein [Pseudomonas sp.]MDP3848413.1 hypothetical protein [Pseudomonas sp.]
MTKDRKDNGGERRDDSRQRSDIFDNARERNTDFGEGPRRNVNDVVDTLSPPPRRDRGNENGGSDD